MKVRELLSDETKWTQGASARQPDTSIVGIYSRSAVCWCLLGALRKCYPYKGDRDIAYNRLLGIIPTLDDGISGVLSWNDNLSRTFAEVKAAVELADI